MRRSITLLAAVSSLAVFAAPANAFIFSIQPSPQTPWRHLSIVKRAIDFQVNRQVARRYTLDPISFAPGGIPVHFASYATVQRVWAQDGGDPATVVTGLHSYGQREIWISAATSRDDWTTSLSHEIIEASVDPTGVDRGLEIADPAEGFAYRLWGVAVSGWALPSGGVFRPIASAWA
jgi:hypothetical protein